MIDEVVDSENFIRLMDYPQAKEAGISKNSVDERERIKLLANRGRQRERHEKL